MSYSLGIDVGNTYVKAALARATAIQVFSFGGAAVVVPAAVHPRGDGTLARATASSAGGHGSDQIIGGLMSRLGDPTPVLLDGEPYAVTELLGALLRDVAQEVTVSQGEPPDQVVLTHPASWGPFRRVLFDQAAREANLHDALMVTEPEAAAAYYSASHHWDDGDTLAVHDLGGDTFNATVLLKQSGGIHILGEPERIEGLGGHDVDEAILSYVNDALSRTLRSAEVEPADLNAVLLVGGSSRLPLVARMVSAELNCRFILDAHPQHAVALGATLAAQSTRARPARRQRHSAVRATRVAGLAEQHQRQPRIPAQRTAGTIPAQRAPGRHAPTATRTAAGTSRSSPDMQTVPSAPPVVSPRPERPPKPVVTPPLPPADTTPPAVRPAGDTDQRPPHPALASNGTQPRVLIGTGMAIALTGSILLALFAGKSSPQAAAPSALARPPLPQTTTVIDLGPETPIPVVAATIPLEQSPSFVTVSPTGRYAYLANADAQTVTVLDTAGKRVIATIPTSTGPPRFLALAPDGRMLYVSIFNDQRTIHAIDVLDTGTSSVVATIPQPARPYLPAVSPDGKRLFVPNHDVAAVSVIDTATKTVIAQIGVAPNPLGIAFTPDGSRAYAANHESNLVSVIDTATLRVLATIPVGSSPRSIAVNPRRPLAANVNFESASVSVINTTTQQVIATIPVGQQPQDIAWDSDGRFAYAVNQGSNTVSVIDSTTDQVTTTIPTGAGPTSIAMLPNSWQAYVSDSAGKALTVLDLAH